jgi:hypothetical protein
VREDVETIGPGEARIEYLTTRTSPLERTWIRGRAKGKER